MSKFWHSLMVLWDIHFHPSFSHHPQTEGSFEILNRMIENLLCCYCFHHQTGWDTLHTSAEFAYSSSHLESIGSTPFALDLYWTPKPPLDLLHSLADTNRESINEFRLKRAESYTDAKLAHELAQAWQSTHNSQRYRSLSYKIGDHIWLDQKYFSDA